MKVDELEQFLVDYQNPDDDICVNASWLQYQLQLSNSRAITIPRLEANLNKALAVISRLQTTVEILKDLLTTKRYLNVKA